MKLPKPIRTAFNVASMAIGGAAFIYGASGFVMGGWSTAGQPGGMDFTLLGGAITVIGAALLYAGYKGLTKPELGDPDHEQAIEDIVQAEIEHGQNDPAEGVPTQQQPKP